MSAVTLLSTKKTILMSKGMIDERYIHLILTSDVDPVLEKNRIQGFSPQTTGDFLNSIEKIF